MDAVILSAALDTNGQNARFVEAARRHGTSKRVLSALAIGNSDPAGVVGRFQQAAEKHGGLRIRSAHKSAAYFAFPGDIVWDAHSEGEIRALIQQADVVHLNNSAKAMRRFRIRKPMLLHHHGTLFRSDPDSMLALARQYRMVQAVSTIDLTRPDPKVLHWLPTAYDIAALQAFGKSHRRMPDGMVRVVHAPTNRQGKHTATLIAAVEKLKAEGLPVELDLVEGVTNAECMDRKAQADILFDQLAWGYGCNSVEAWGLGIPVISGADRWTLDRMKKEWGGLPFLEAAEKTLTAVLRKAIESAGLRAEWAERGMAHVRRFHDEVPALAKLAELYVMAIAAGGRAAPPPLAEPVRFRYYGRVTLRHQGQDIIFVDGEAAVTDPELVTRLRYLARRPSFGVEEVA